MPFNHLMPPSNQACSNLHPDPRPGWVRPSVGCNGVHLAIDLSQGSALTWVAGELAVALAEIGQRVTIPRVGALSPTLEERLRDRLCAMMTDQPSRECHIRLNHYWPQFLMQEVSGEINAELFVTNYRFRGAMQPLDMWSRHLVANGVRKLPMSSFCGASLQDLGVPAAQCAVVPLGYSPEIETLFPAGKPPGGIGVRKLLVVTNSHDINRYGTDILIPAMAKAYTEHDPVEIHIKDYGASPDRPRLRELIAAQRSFPKVVWHETFLEKADLIRLYGDMDLMVSPFRGEGYAMKIIDAMALGLPVMMPAFGGPMEYAPGGGFLSLPFDEVPVGKCLDTDNYLVGPGAYWCEVREESLVAALRAYLDDPTTAERAATVARAHVFGRYTWKNAAVALVNALDGWRAEMEATVRNRRRPASLPLSVIIPTKDRPVELAKTLEGYAAQDDSAFEILVINDHGDSGSVRDIVASFGALLRARVLENDGPPGPGAARNRGIEQAEGAIVLVTGDDIIPAPDLVARHRDAHRRHPGAQDAFVGKVDWHPEMTSNWFIRHIVAEGAQQFDYRSLRDEQVVPFDRFYTSNVSWKRGLTANVEWVFNEGFRLAAYEDVELGYRLSQRGMRLRYLEHAVGYHLHPMTARSFFERMRRVGKMRTVLAGIHPQVIGNEGLSFYTDLEVERRRRDLCRLPGGSASWEGVLGPLAAVFDRLDAWAAADVQMAGAAADRIGHLESRVLTLRRRLFDDLCEAFMQVGQAQEWARESPDLAWAPEWIATLWMAEHDGRRHGEPGSAPQPAPPPQPVPQAPKKKRPPKEGAPHVVVERVPPIEKKMWLVKRLVLRFGFARRVREWLRQMKRRRTER